MKKTFLIFALFLLFFGGCSGRFVFRTNRKQDFLRTITPIEKCGDLQLHCQSGECISITKFCDGAVDCSDGSDETSETCSSMTCPSYSFQCAYGACVPKNAKCNGKKDCADNSDEADCKGGVEQSCEPLEWRCNNGQCINRFVVCNGLADCLDGSDETYATCGNMSCPTQYFQCGYGACVDGGAACNGVKECVDGSDESKALCDVTTTEGGCKLPNLPENGWYTLNEKIYNVVPGKVVPGPARLDYSCNDGYRLYSVSCIDTSSCTSDVSCIISKNKWNRPLPKCLRTCRELTSASTDLTCTYGQTKIPCDKPVYNGTVVKVKCKEKYFYPEDKFGVTTFNPILRCQADGNWDKDLPQCTPECGLKNSEYNPLVIGGAVATAPYPWHVGIYRILPIGNKKYFDQICGGSILSALLIITAAHCFEFPKPDLYAIAAGKLYRAWDFEEKHVVQHRMISKIVPHERYAGSLNNYVHDIAVVVLKGKPLEFNSIISPVCIDWKRAYEKEDVENAQGTVVGWGKTSAGGPASEQLKELNMSYVPLDKCFDKSSPQFRPVVLSDDKFCAGDLNGANVCNGDSGGGLVFFNSESKLYVLRGIVSLGPSKDKKCDPLSYVTFTNITYYIDWLQVLYSTYRDVTLIKD